MPTTQRWHKSVCVPFNEENYTTLLEDPEAFRGYLNTVYQEQPELFREGMGDGFCLAIDVLPQRSLGEMPDS